jgi:hypothetical protein
VPRPLLQLKAQIIDLLVEKTLGIRVRGDQPDRTWHQPTRQIPPPPSQTDRCSTHRRNRRTVLSDRHGLDAWFNLRRVLRPARFGDSTKNALPNQKRVETVQQRVQLASEELMNSAEYHRSR